MEMEKRLHARDAAFDGQPDNDSENERPSPANYLQDYSADPAKDVEASQWASMQEKELHGALRQLDDRSHDIIARRWLRDDKATLQELATEYGVSAERIRQLESNAIKRLRKSMHNWDGAPA